MMLRYLKPSGSHVWLLDSTTLVNNILRQSWQVKSSLLSPPSRKKEKENRFTDVTIHILFQLSNYSGIQANLVSLHFAFSMSILQSISILNNVFVPIFYSAKTKAKPFYWHHNLYFLSVVKLKRNRSQTCKLALRILDVHTAVYFYPQQRLS